jgi:undecaprenyl diphosphate synthase
MDGNGRWAKEKFLPRVFGHQAGIKTLRSVVESCPNYGVKYLTVYAFSSENWKRPYKEVENLMSLLSFYFQNEKSRLHKEGVCVKVIGDRQKLPSSILDLVDAIEDLTKDNHRFYLQIALSYGGREEITRAAKKLAEKVSSGNILLKDVTEEIFQNFLDTSFAPDPDILIRTGGEMRLSNYLLWQLCYSELFFVEKYWPDFLPDDLEEIIGNFKEKRHRRFGNVSLDAVDDIKMVDVNYAEAS